MRFQSFISVLLYLFASNACCCTNMYGNTKQENCTDSLGEPLILTPLIKRGKIKEAQSAAEVKFNDLQNVKSYAAYLTVNELYNSNLFFWFFPSQTDYTSAPVILWLQGGPGATSLMGLFTENGPFEIHPEEGLNLRKITWTENNSVIYIDNPVGTGYSFTDEGGYAKNETIVGAQLYDALLQFFQLFPELQKNDFFIAGQSYAGKYVPAVAYTIYKNNPSAEQKINLQGLSIGNGFSDPEHQSDYSDYLHQIGLIDINDKARMKDLEQEGIKYIQNKQWLKAYNLFDKLIAGDLNKSTFFKAVTGFDNYCNYLTPNDTTKRMEFMEKFVQREDMRMAIHVGNTSFHAETEIVLENLKEDVMQSVAPWISELLNHYRILMYSGQLDIIVAYPMTVKFLKNLKFSGAEVYKTAVRHQWWVDNELAGYVKQAENLTEVLVRNAGHMVPRDQPRWALDLITRFTRNKPFW